MEAKINGREIHIFSRGNKAHLSIYRRDKIICDCKKGKETQTGFEIEENRIICPYCLKSFELKRPEPPKNSGMMKAISEIAQIMVDEGVEVPHPLEEKIKKIRGH